MDAASARKEEILAKKAKLEELRRTRLAREKDLQRSKTDAGGSPGLAQPIPTRADRARDVDKIIEGLGLVGSSRPGSTGPAGSPRAGSRSRPESVLSGSNRLSDEQRASTPRLSSGSGGPRDSQISGTTYVTSATQTLSLAPLLTVYEQPSDAPPKREIITYSKGVQTGDDIWDPKRNEKGVGVDDEDWLEDGSPPPERLEELRQNIRKEIEEELKATTQSGSGAVQPTQEEERFPARQLSTEELEAVTASKEFQEFLDQSTKVIERALDEEYDLLTDYAHGKANLDDDDEGYSGRGKRGRRVKELHQFWDERWSKKRMISDIDFSPHVRLPGLLEFCKC
jgi:dynein intermediate chain